MSFLPSDLIMNKRIDKFPTLKYIFHEYLIKHIYKLREIDACSVDMFIFHIDFRLCILYTDNILSTFSLNQSISVHFHIAVFCIL